MPPWLTDVKHFVYYLGLIVGVPTLLAFLYYAVTG